MNSEPDDNTKNIGEIIKKMLNSAGLGDHPSPVIFNFRIFVNMPGNPGGQPERVTEGQINPIEPVVEVQRVDGEIELLTEMPGISPRTST